jgi:hypothetical protein
VRAVAAGVGGGDVGHQPGFACTSDLESNRGVWLPRRQAEFGLKIGLACLIGDANGMLFFFVSVIMCCQRATSCCFPKTNCDRRSSVAGSCAH